MPTFHDETNHSYMSIRKNQFFLDWRTQPKNYKTYPHFHQRFKIEDYEELKDLNLMGGITFEKEYPDGKYYLRTVPSAGGLYPFELYLQIRGIRGLIEGVYHYEPYSKTLCLIHELNRDGVEYYFKDRSKQKGIIFLISTIYFRSSWKYRDRSIRYILLDSGHQLGAIYAALCVMDRDKTINFNFDKLNLNNIFGFRDDEMFTAAVTSSQKQEKGAEEIKVKFPYVCGTDYNENNPFINKAYEQSAVFDDNEIGDPGFFKDTPNQVLKNAITERRSIRAFRGIPMEKNCFDFIVKDLYDFAKSNNIEIFYTLHSVNGMKEGLYRFDELISEGDFSMRSKYLALEQNLGGQSSVTFYFTSKEEEKYQKANILSGFIAQIIYLRSTIKDIGCSGIGAYYDEETKEFLKTKNNILYLLAIGK